MFYCLGIFYNTSFSNTTDFCIKKINNLCKNRDLSLFVKFIVTIPDNQRIEIAQALIAAKSFSNAYQVLARHKTNSTRPRLYMEIEWLSGFIALIYLNDNNVAVTHFSNMANSVIKHEDKSKAAFWLGLAFQAQGNLSMMLFWLAIASQFSATFYGQLAQVLLQRVFTKYPERINHQTPFGNANITCLKNSLSTWIASFMRQDDHIIANSQYNYLNNAPFTSLSIISQYFYDIDNLLSICIYQKFLQNYTSPLLKNYPLFSAQIPYEHLHTLFSKMTKVLNEYNFMMVLAHAIALHESSFNSRATSHAGAKGIMQLMPKTASSEVNKLVDNKLLKKSDKINIYAGIDNLILGVSHIKTLIEEFGFNIVLIAAAYNAGKNNVYKWIDKFGDPRTNAIPMMHWIELIPFSETRHYVQRVIEAFVVYTHILDIEYLQNVVWSLFR